MQIAGCRGCVVWINRVEKQGINIQIAFPFPTALHNGVRNGGILLIKNLRRGIHSILIFVIPQNAVNERGTTVVKVGDGSPVIGGQIASESNVANGWIAFNVTHPRTVTSCHIATERHIADRWMAIGQRACLVTADHGNCEQMKDPETMQDHTAHTQNPVPLVYVGAQQVEFAPGGTLSDIAPTLLDLMHLDIPQEMTGRSLVNIATQQSA